MRWRSPSIVLVSCAVLLGVVYVAVLHPKLRTLADLHGQLVVLHAQSADLMALQDEVTAARLMLAQAKDIEENLRARFLRKDGVGGFAAEIAGHARRAGLTVVHVRPSPVRPTKDCDVVSFEIRLTGRFPDLVRLLESLSTTGIAYSVESMVLQTDPSTGQGAIQLILETYLLKEGSA